MRLTAGIGEIGRFTGAGLNANVVRFRHVNFPTRAGEAIMKFGAALVCIAVLYSVDALVFDGRYTAAVTSVLSEIYKYG